MLGLIDYGAGNLQSVQNALAALDVPYICSGDPHALAAADRLLLPGVGAFPAAMAALTASGLIPFIQAAVSKKPLLGICLGMQILFDYGTEFNRCEGLGLIAGHVTRLTGGKSIPHMGWNSLQFACPSPLLQGVAPGEYMYFVHSYKAVTQAQHIAARCQYGEEIPALVQKGRVFGAQFHPEKSCRAGLTILENFCKTDAALLQAPCGDSGKD